MNGDFKENYFCAANSGRGFFSLYPQMIGRAERVYIVKGGPGCGKSRFLHRVAKEAEARGRRVTYYYCSSDPSSLDAVFIDERLLLLDGTAPHAVEASLPGARDDLVELGAFWDSSRLAERRGEIEGLAKRKSEAYSRAYDCLSAAASIGLAADKLVAPAVLTDKLKGAAERAVRALPESPAFSERAVLLGSFGMRGDVRLDSFFESADEYVSVTDHGGISHLFLGALYENAKRRGLSVSVSLDPLFPDRLDAIRFEDARLVYETGLRSEKRINMKRFLDGAAVASVKGELRELTELKRAALSGALGALTSAAEAHFELEKIYGETMDFAAKERFTDSFIGKIF